MKTYYYINLFTLNEYEFKDFLNFIRSNNINGVFCTRSKKAGRTESQYFLLKQEDAIIIKIKFPNSIILPWSVRPKFDQKKLYNMIKEIFERNISIYQMSRQFAKNINNDYCLTSTR